MAPEDDEVGDTTEPRGRLTRRRTVLAAVAVAVVAVGAALLFAGLGGETDPAGSSSSTTTRADASTSSESGSESESTDSSTPSSPDTSSSTTASVPPAAPAVEPDDLDVLEELPRGSQDLVDVIDQCRDGEPGSCEAVIDVLERDCADGFLAACDGLYAVAPDGSDLEAFAATCGSRFDGTEYAGACAEQGG